MAAPRRVKGTLTGLAIAGAAIAALPWWLPTGWIGARIEREATAALGTPVSIGKISLFWTGAGITDLRIKNPPSFPAGSAVEIAGIRAAAPLSSLLKGGLDGLSVAVTEPVIRLSAAPDGSLNVAALGNASAPPEAGAPAGKGPIPLPAASLRVERGSVFLPGSPDSAVRIPLATVTLSPDADLRLVLETLLPEALGGGSVNVRADASLRLPGPVEIRSLAASFPGGSIEASGRIDPAAPGGADFAIDARIAASLGELAGTLGLPLPSGTLAQALSLSGNAGETTVRLEGRASDLAHALLRWPPSELGDSVRIRWVPATRTLEIPEMKLSLSPPGLSLEASGTVVGPGEEGFARSVDLSLAARLAPGEAAAAGGMTLSADALSGSAKVSGTPDAIVLEATGTGRDVRLSGGNLPAVLVLAALDLEQKALIFPREKRIEIQTSRMSTDFLSLQAGPGSLGWGEDGNASLSLRLQADLAGMSRWAGSFIAWPAGIPSPKGRLTASADVSGTPASRSGRSDIAWTDAALAWPDGRTLDLEGALAVSLEGAATGGPRRSFALDRFSARLQDQGRGDIPPKASVSAGGIRFTGEGGLRAEKPVEISLPDLAAIRSLLTGAGILPAVPDVAGAVSAGISGIEIDGEGSGKARLALDARSLSVRPDGMTPVSLASLKLGTDVSFDPGKGAFAASGLSLDATGLSLSTPALDATGGFRAPETSLSSSTAGLAGKGSLDLSPLGITVKGETAPLFRKKAGDAWDFSWDLTGDSAGGTWNLRAFRLGMPAGTLEGSGRVSTIPALAFDATLADSRIDLAKLAESVPALAAAGATGSVTLGGTVSQGPAGPKAGVACLFEKASLAPAGSSPVLLDGRLSYEADPAGADRLAGEGLSIEAAGQKGTLALDLAGIRDAAAGAASPDALLGTLSGTLRLALPSYAFQKNQLKDLVFDLAFSRGKPARLAARSAVNQGTCSVEATLAPAGDHALRLTLDKANLDVSDARLLSLALPFIPAAGGRAVFTINTDSRILATGLDPAGLADTLRTPGIQKILLTDGFVEGSLLMGALAEKLKMVELSKIRFTKVEQDYEIRDRRVTNHLTRIEGDIPMDIRGWTAFDGTMEHRILILGRLAEGDGQAARVLRALNAAGGIRAWGNAASPSIDVDYDKLAAKILEEELKARRKGMEDDAKDKGLELIEDLFKKKKKR